MPEFSSDEVKVFGNARQIRAIQLIKPEADNQLITLGKTVADMQTRIEELEEMTKEQRERLLELEQLVPPLEELMKFKYELYSKQNKES